MPRLINRREGCTRATWALLAAFGACFAVTALAQSSPGASPAPRFPLRVVCRGGQAPFVTIDSNTSQCGGILTDFLSVALSSTYDWNPVADPAADVVQLLANSSSPVQADLFISFLTVTPERQGLMEFTPTILQTDYKCILAQTESARLGSLAGAIVRDTVLHVVAVLVLLAWGAAVIFFVFESLSADSVFADVALWRRITYCVNAGLELVMTQSGPDFSSEVAMATKSLVGLTSLFVVAIFGALVTSKLTISALQQTTIEVKDLRNKRIGASGAQTTAFLSSADVGAVVVGTGGSAETLVEEMVTQGNPRKLFGVVTNTPVADYVVNSLEKRGLPRQLQTKPFFLSSNTYEIKSCAMSRALNASIRTDISLKVLARRDDGTLATMVNKEIGPTSESDASDDIPVASTEFDALRYTCVALFSLTALVILVSMVRELWQRRSAPASSPSSRRQSSAGAKNASSSGAPVFDDDNYAHNAFAHGDGADRVVDRYHSHNLLPPGFLAIRGGSTARHGAEATAHQVTSVGPTTGGTMQEHEMVRPHQSVAWQGGIQAPNEGGSLTVSYGTLKVDIPVTAAEAHVLTTVLNGLRNVPVHSSTKEALVASAENRRSPARTPPSGENTAGHHTSAVVAVGASASSFAPALVTPRPKATPRV